MRFVFPSRAVAAIRCSLLAGVVAFGLVLGGCDILNVENPNNLEEGQLGNPTAAVPIANGAEGAVTRALGAILSAYSTATDELVWIGSRDAWFQLDRGFLNDPANEFTDAAFPYVGEARFTASEAVRRLEEFQAEGELDNEQALVRAYLYKAIIHTVIADMFDDFVISNRREAGMPLGEAGMVALYDTAIVALDKAIALGGGDLDPALLGMRARAKYSKGLWNKINPTVDTANPLVYDEGAVEDARAALELMGEDYRFKLTQPETGDLVVGDLSIGLQVNNRLEMRISDNYVIAAGPRPAGFSDGAFTGGPATTVSLKDPIDGTPSEEIYRAVVEFTEAERNNPITVVSAREMHLILAEAALAQGDEAGFAEQVNEVRALDGLTPYTPGAGGLSPVKMLNYERRENLFLQGRRLADHYRFADYPALWEPDSDAVLQPGTLFPITVVESRANENIPG